MSASNDADEAMIARWETTAHGIYTGENATEFARLIALARRTTAAEARVEELEAGLKRLADAVGNMKAPQNTLDVGVLVLVTVGPALEHARKLLENKP